MSDFKTLDDVSFQGKRVLLRVDLNVPMEDGKVTDKTRIERVAGTIREIAGKGGRVVLLAHFGRPKGKKVESESLAPVVEAVAGILDRKVAFADDCIGEAAKTAVDALDDGEILLLENTRFHAGEENNDPDFAKALAANGDLYVNDAFSAAHRAHASTEAVARLMPAAAGPLMMEELGALQAALDNPARPSVAIVGGAKVSSKIAVLKNLVQKVDHVIVGGGMANTFLFADGAPMGKSLHEADQLETVREIRTLADAYGCQIHLPADVVVAREFRAGAEAQIVAAAACPEDAMILDAGPQAVAAFTRVLEGAKTILWNGPLGAFEMPPFDKATAALAQVAADLTRGGTAVSVAGGGDTVAALNTAQVAKHFTYVSSAGGAFLEWLEGRSLPGVAALMQDERV